MMTTFRIGACALLAIGCWACVGAQPGRESTADPGALGYKWTGPGEGQGFAPAYEFCRRSVELASIDRGAGESLGGGATVWDSSRLYGSSPQTSSFGTGGGYVNQRQFQQCMQGRGWTKEDAPPPTAATPGTAR